MAYLWLKWILLGAAVLPSLCYILIILAAISFFRRRTQPPQEFAPAVSVLKPVHGLDPEAYENFATFCRQDYPAYEILFAANDEQDAAVPVIRQLIADFPDLSIRLIVGREKFGTNDKVNKLCGLARAARHNLLVISDADVRVGPRYLRTMTEPFRDPQVGVVSSLFTGIPAPDLWPELEALCLSTEFMPSVLLARLVEGVRFALGATIAVSREYLAEIGGFEALADEAADDYEIGRRATARGRRAELVDASVKTWCCPTTFREFFHQRLRWAIMARQARPWGYFGLMVTQGLPWTVLAALLAPTRLLAAGFVAGYLILRFAEVRIVGAWGLRDSLLRRRWWLVPLWDALAFAIWASSLFWNEVRWQGADYRVAGGRLVPVARTPEKDRSGER